jgi:hypothetical protein
MAKAKTITKTWKLGEVCQGGIITVEIQGNSIAIIGKEWDFSTGSRRSSDQSNAKEFRRDIVAVDDSGASYKLRNILCDLSTSYHSDEISKWIESKVKLGGMMGW